ncbi:hypothetical protein CONPUDRAFT_81410, partial [Coniophora puteana RWD-64-598 SS2]
MHHALEISEVIQLVLSHVDNHWALENLAQVSKAFHEPAINALYSELDFWFEILRCLPQDLRKFKQEERPEGAFCGNWQPPWTIVRRSLLERNPLHYYLTGAQSFRRKMTEEEWALLRSRAANVHSIGVRDTGRDEVDPKEWHMYSHQSPFAAAAMTYQLDQSVIDAFMTAPQCLLFPSLRVLTLGHGCPPAILPMFLPPCLRRLRLSINAISDIARLPLSITELCPAVDSFSCHGHPLRNLDVSCRFISGWKHLRSITGVVPLDTHMWKHLTSLESLKTLEVHTFTPYSRPWFGTNISCLREIDNLSLTSGNFKGAADSLEGLLCSDGRSTKASVRQL